MSGWLGEGFQLFILWILGAKVWQQNWQYVSKSVTFKVSHVCLTRQRS